MSEETKEVATPPTPNNTEVEQLKESIKKLEAKNYELIGKLQNQKKETKVPEDYESLLAFKQKHEREQLESEGKYTEATQALCNTPRGPPNAAPLSVLRRRTHKSMDACIRSIGSTAFLTRVMRDIFTRISLGIRTFRTSAGVPSLSTHITPTSNPSTLHKRKPWSMLTVISFEQAASVS